MAGWTVQHTLTHSRRQRGPAGALSGCLRPVSKAGGVDRLGDLRCPADRLPVLRYLGVHADADYCAAAADLGVSPLHEWEANYQFDWAPSTIR